MTVGSVRMTPTDAHDQRLGVALVASAAVAWSTAGYFTRLIDVPLFPLLIWRNIFGGLFMLGFVVWTERGATVGAFRGLGRIGWFAAVVNGVSMVCYLAALRHTSVVNVVVIYATAPFVAAALAFVAVPGPGDTANAPDRCGRADRRGDHRRGDADHDRSRSATSSRSG